MTVPSAKHGHPRLWISPEKLNSFLSQSRGGRRQWRIELLRILNRQLDDSANARATFNAQKSNEALWSPTELSLALGVAWRMTHDRRYAAAAWWLLEDLELWVDSHCNYDAWGSMAEAAAYLYDWFHDHWISTGQDRLVAEFTALSARRALDDLLHRYILEDWHNYSLGLQSGILASAVALGTDHPDIENGALMKTMAAWHFTGYRDASLRMQDCHKLPPATRLLEAGLRMDGGAGFACLYEAAGAYHAIDAWEIVKMAEFWSHGTTACAQTGGCVWPELTLAGDAIIQTLRPDGMTVAFGDGGSHKRWALQGRVLRILNARHPDPSFAWFTRQRGENIKEQLPIFPLIYGSPNIKTAQTPALSACVRPLACMRSGWGADASMVTFRCGGHGGWHNHLDHNSFTVFCGSPLAIDAGGGNYETAHRPNYSSRTIAHNAMLVRDPSEKSWSGRYKTPVVNDGGQRLVTLSYIPPNEITGGPHAPLCAQRRKLLHDEFDMGSILAFETRKDMDYVAGDATSAYTYPWSGMGDNPSRRVEEAIRQIVFLKPSIVIIFDRVEATKAKYTKTWLLHSIGVPIWTLDGRRIKPKPGVTACPSSIPLEIEHGRGRLTVWPLLPDERRVRVIGGKGYEWWVEGAPGSDSSGGRNFPPTSGGDETGAWRIEISPICNVKRDIFLTALHAGLCKQPHTLDQYAFHVEVSGGETLLTIFQKGKTHAPTLLRFHNHGRVVVTVSGATEPFSHAAPAPTRIPCARKI